jgi:UDP-3-O-[3-hydroxymyristoyl] glucosamine N-acyltransferase
MSTNIHPSAVIDATVQLGDNVVVGPNAVIDVGAVIGSGNIIDANVVIGKNVKIGDNNQLFANCAIGRPPQLWALIRAQKSVGLRSVITILFASRLRYIRVCIPGSLQR